MKYKVKHVTTYEYQSKASTSQTKAWLLPRELPYQKCEEQELVVFPATSDIKHRKDFFGNWVSYFSLNTPHNQMVITSSSIIERSTQPSLNQQLTTDLPWRESLKELKKEPQFDVELSQFLLPSHYTQWTDEMVEYASTSFDENRSMLEAVSNLMSRIFHDFEFKSGFTTLNTPITEVMKERKGVCQDFSHLMLAMLRGMGLPARYMSGYLETLPPPGKEKLQGSDASHAWVSVYILGRGWVDFDPTNNMLPAERHITVGWGRDYGDVPPVKGVIQSSGSHRLSVAVDIIPMD